MKKRILLVLIILSITTVNAKTYFLTNISTDNKIKKYAVTNNDNYNYGDFIIHQGQSLIVSREDGIVSNDILKVDDYEIVLLEYSDNSSLNDIKIDLINGSFQFKPNFKVKNEVIFEYYIIYEIDGIIYESNKSLITFNVLEKEVPYVINYYEESTNKKIMNSVTKYGNYGDRITEIALNIDKYNTVNPYKITKNLELKDNSFNFYYSNIPNTGI